MGPVTVAVLGAGNQIGAFLIPRLLDRGYQVVAVSRRAQPTWIETHPGLDWRSQDLQQGLTAPLQAAVLIYIAPLPLFETAWRSLDGVKQVIAFSSTSRYTKRRSTVASERELAAVLESGEATIRSVCQQSQTGCTILRPTLVYGAGLDRSLTRLAHWIRRWPRCPLPGPGKGMRQPVHAGDLAEAVLAAMDRSDTVGAEYDLPGGETLSYREMVERIGRSVGREHAVIGVPSSLARTALAIARWFPPFRDLTPAMLDRIEKDLVFDAAPAREDLGYQPRPFQPDATTWEVSRRPGDPGSQSPDRR